MGHIKTLTDQPGYLNSRYYGLSLVREIGPVEIVSQCMTSQRRGNLLPIFQVESSNRGSLKFVRIIFQGMFDFTFFDVGHLCSQKHNITSEHRILTVFEICSVKIETL